MSEEFSMILFHRNGCGGPALFFKKTSMLSNRLVQHTDVMRLDGTLPAPFDRVACGTCGETLSNKDFMIDFIKPKDAGDGIEFPKAIAVTIGVLALMVILTFLIMRPDRQPCHVAQIVASWLACDHAGV